MSIVFLIIFPFSLHLINNIIKQIVLSIVPFLFAATIHEFMHGFVAYKLGDNTAKNEGRLTLNPIAHIDPIGLLCLVVTRSFGWAKPVPVNFYQIRHKYGMALVSVAGPLSNLFLAIFSVGLLHLFEYMVYNITMPESIVYPIGMMIYYSIGINVALFVFNLLPILPLDGGRIIYNFLPYNLASKFEVTEKYGFIIILFLIFTGVIKYLIIPPMNLFYKLIM